MKYTDELEICEESITEMKEMFHQYGVLDVSKLLADGLMYLSREIYGEIIPLRIKKIVHYSD